MATLMSVLLFASVLQAEVVPEKSYILLTSKDGFTRERPYDASAPRIYATGPRARIQILSCNTKGCIARFTIRASKIDEARAVQECELRVAAAKVAEAETRAEIAREIALEVDGEVQKTVTDTRAALAASLETLKQVRAGKSTGICHAPEFETNYFFPADLLADYDFRPASGLVAGALAVPFKLQLSELKITAGGTVGGALGYRLVLTRQLSLAFVGSLGLSFVSTAAPTADDAAATDALPAFAIAGGAVLQFLSTQFGLVTGVDLFQPEYTYNSQPWAALAIGFNFL